MGTIDIPGIVNDVAEDGPGSTTPWPRRACWARRYVATTAVTDISKGTGVFGDVLRVVGYDSRPVRRPPR